MATACRPLRAACAFSGATKLRRACWAHTMLVLAVVKGWRAPRRCEQRSQSGWELDRRQVVATPPLRRRLTLQLRGQVAKPSRTISRWRFVQQRQQAWRRLTNHVPLSQAQPARVLIWTSPMILAGGAPDEAYGVGDRMRLAARQLPGPNLARSVNCPTAGGHLNLRGPMGVVVNDAEAGDLADLPPAPCYAAEARQALLRATAGA